MHAWIEDVRHAARRLAAARAFTTVAVLTLALGIGANTAIFSVVHAVLLRPLPFADPDRVFAVATRHTSTDRYPMQLAEYCEYRDQNTTLAGLAGWGNWNANLTGDGPAERINGVRTTANLFDLLGARAALGRPLRPEDDEPGEEKKVVISYGLWQRRFGFAPDLVGRAILLNGEPYTVVGVMEREFLFPTRTSEIAVPLVPERDPARHNWAATSFLRAVARAKPGVTREQIGEDLGAILHRIQKEHGGPSTSKLGALAVPYAEELTRNFSRTLWVLLGAVALLLLIACANLANLMLVRAGDRRRDLAIRQALGASRGRLLREMTVESALLALAGATCALLIARWTVPLLVALSPEALPRGREVHLSAPVLLFTMAATLLATATFGLLPALRASRVDAAASLKAETLSASGDVARRRARGWIVTAQVALMVVLLTGAGLLFKSFREVLRVEPGFDPTVLTVRLSLPRPEYAQIARVSAFFDGVAARLKEQPGILSVAAVNHVPLNGALASAEYKPSDDATLADDKLPTAQYRMATPDFFKTMGIPLLAGRTFDDRDREGSALVAIISRRIARQSFGDRDPIGRHILVRDAQAFRTMEVVGMVADVHHGSLETDAEPHLYVPYHQTNPNLVQWLTQNQFLVVRTAGPAMDAAEGVKRAIAAVDARVAAADVRPTGFYLEAAAAPRRFALQLLGGFTLLALLLAALGMYGVAAHAVAQRTREIGVRVALGARPRDIARVVVGEGLRRTVIGIVIGWVAAFAAGRAVAGLLYGVRATDPVTHGAVLALLVAVTVLASLLPARRASRVDPLVALRQG